LYGDPAGVFVHDLILNACRRFGERTALVDCSCDPPRRLTYAEYGDLVEKLGASLSSRLQPGETVAISLFNSWEFCVSYHAVTLAGCIPTLLNPLYRDREVHHQLEDSGAALFIAGGAQLSGVRLEGLSKLREVFGVREGRDHAEDFEVLLKPSSQPARRPQSSSQEAIAALPYSSGTTGMPKGVMLSHNNLVTNVFQFLTPGEDALYTPDEVVLCCLPLYHIYGLNVVLNPTLAVGATLVLMPRFDESHFLRLISEEQATFLPVVPPLINCLSIAAEQGRFPREHRVRYSKSGAAPLAPDLAWRFTGLTGIRVRQGYGMTEASPVTHLGYLEADRYRPDSIGHAVAQTDCRLFMSPGACYGELVMRGPQFMLDTGMLPTLLGRYCATDGTGQAM
jgi:4-coumarate--CoA ligase